MTSVTGTEVSVTSVSENSVAGPSVTLTSVTLTEVKGTEVKGTEVTDFMCELVTLTSDYCISTLPLESNCSFIFPILSIYVKYSAMVQLLHKNYLFINNLYSNKFQLHS